MTKPLLVQIGVFLPEESGDPLYEHILSNKYNCHLVEPNTECHNTIKQTYKNVDELTIYDLAISSYDGRAMFYRDIELAKSNIASLSTGLLAWHHAREQRMNSIVGFEVQCKTLNTFLDEIVSNNTTISYLCIDTEGSDTDIILSTDFSKYDIKNLIFECHHSDGPYVKGPKLETTINHLKKFGFSNFTYDEYNCICEKLQ